MATLQKSTARLTSLLLFASVVACNDAAPTRAVISKSSSSKPSVSDGDATGVKTEPEDTLGDKGSGNSDDDEDKANETDNGGTKPKDMDKPTTDKPSTGTPKPDVGTPDTSMPMNPEKFDVSLVSVDVKNDKNGIPLKGDNVFINLSLKNVGGKAGTLKVTPYLTSKRFTDFTNVKLPTVDIALKGAEAKVAPIKIENFFQDLGGSKKEYALNRGEYSLAFEIEGEGIAKKRIADLKGKDFLIDKSNVVFTAVYWHQSYFDKVKYTGGVQKWMEETFSRKGEINDGNRTTKSFAKGFDEMMGIRTVFKTFEGFRLDRNKDFSGVGILNQVEDYSKERLGLKDRFKGTDCNSFTHKDNHGFDMQIGLSNDGFGGLAWVCGNTQASGIFDADTSKGRAQMILIHETGHNFGAPHCDPIQGFIMCSGEKHANYLRDGSFVWHQVSIDAMKKREADRINLVGGVGGLSLAAMPDGNAANEEIAVCNGEHM